MPSPHDMSPEEFRRHGRAVVDWIADYWERVGDLPVRSCAEPGDLRCSLPACAPRRGEDFGEMLADVDRLIMPGLTHWQSPNFFAYFPANVSGPSVLGELLSAGLGVQGMLWATSPACTELEAHVLDWLVPMLGLPEEFLSTGSGGGVLQDSASSASLCALLAAREEATGLESNRQGVRRPLVAYVSSQTHSSLEKAVRIAGVGSENLRTVPVDDRFAMRTDELARAVAEDRGRNLEPFFVCATVGTTSSHAIDPVADLAEVARKENLWLHVDAAMAGSAALCEEHRYIHDGVERADSYCFNPHKWLLTNFDCCCFWVRDRRPLLRALSILPEYLRSDASDDALAPDYRDWQIPLGRRFRALKLWFVIRHYGVEGLQALVRSHIQLARELRSCIEADGDFELMAPTPLNLLCFRHRAGDSFNERLVDRLNDGGRVYLTSTVLDGRTTLRLSIGQANTERRHVRAVWDEIRRTAGELEAASGREES